MADFSIDDLVVTHGPCGCTGRGEDMFDPAKHDCAWRMNRDLLRGMFRDPEKQKPLDEWIAEDERREAAGLPELDGDELDVWEKAHS